MTERQGLKRISNFVQRYRANEMNEQEITEIETQTGKTAEEYVRELEELLEKVKYSLATMTITELRGIIKKPDGIPQIEKNHYVSYNNLSTYEQFIAAAQQRVDEFDGDKARMARRAVAKAKSYARDAKKALIINADMEQLGIAKKEGEGVWQMDFGKWLQYRDSKGKVYAMLYANIKRNPRNMHTMPETGMEQKWFFVTVKNETIRAGRAQKKTPSLITKEIELDPDKTAEMHDLYQMLRRGYRLQRELTLEEEVWLGVLKFTRTPMNA